MMSRKQKIFLNLLGSAIQAFGLYHVHAASGVTEGGILGLMLLLHNWFGISPAWSSLILNAACYLLGWR
ncbi:MAG: YitT family protein, partial [Clostridia bacterium]|nr:YitT family protein [Clostridia bacterium]